jgi:hypothetical protein
LSTPSMSKNNTGEILLMGLPYAGAGHDVERVVAFRR